uniref:NADH-ubiquinone oxidoreductase chain 6 n=1 Tax=Symphurus orientalis TaxID=665865 RepID=A0A0K0Q5Z0_9PLEU|nr:NADH dehydrogenase subunit 6 [Symphurus orientalis]
MLILLHFILLGVLMGVASVASNPSPFFAALGLVLVSVSGCGLIITQGGTFLSVVVMLIYLGGMLVVFAYACSFSAEDHPEGWDTADSKILLVFYGSLVCILGLLLMKPKSKFSWGMLDGGQNSSVWRGDYEGVSQLFQGGGLVLVVVACALLVALLVVMEISRGNFRSALRI